MEGAEREAWEPRAGQCTWQPWGAGDVGRRRLAGQRAGMACSPLWHCRCAGPQPPAPARVHPSAATLRPALC